MAKSGIRPAIRRRALGIAFSASALLGLASVSTASAQTIVSLTFDDGAVSQYSARAPLASRGLHGTFYINSGLVASNSYYMTWAQISGLAADGNEIGGHTLTHKRLPDISATEQRKQICDDAANLRNKGFTVTDFAYPHGAGSTTATVRQALTDCGYKSARKVGGLRSSDCSDCAWAETIPPANIWAIRSNDWVTGPLKLAEVQRYVTQAEQHGGGWVPLMFHDICACGDSSMSLTEFTQLLDWLKARASLGTVVRTVNEVMSGGITLPPPDTTPPTTTIACNGASCPSTALKAPVSVSLSSSDADSGVSAIRYTTDGSDPTQSSTAYSGPFSISKTTTIKYRAWDNVGNAEQVRSQTVKIDTSPPPGTPTATISSPKQGASVSGTVTVIVDATGTGVNPPDVDLYVDGAFTSWRTNVNPPYQISWNASASGKGTHTLKVLVTDTLGNTVRSAPVTVTVTG